MAEADKKSIIEIAYERGIPSGEEIIKTMKKTSDTVLLAFSGGKDALGCWLALRKHFKVVPFFKWYVPDLEFQRRSLDYYEKFFKTRIMRVPHHNVYLMLNSTVWQPPAYAELLNASKLTVPNASDIADLVREDCGLPHAYIAVGIRITDSPQRRAALLNHGPIREATKTVWPCWDWNDARLAAEIEKSGLKLPVDYQMYGRSFDGLNYQYTAELKRRFPEDYQRVLELFPLVEADVKRREYAIQRGIRI
jgi:hypothetical protein